MQSKARKQSSIRSIRFSFLKLIPGWTKIRRDKRKVTSPQLQKLNNTKLTVRQADPKTFLVNALKSNSSIVAAILSKANCERIDVTSN